MAAQQQQQYSKGLPKGRGVQGDADLGINANKATTGEVSLSLPPRNRNRQAGTHGNTGCTQVEYDYVCIILAHFRSRPASAPEHLEIDADLRDGLAHICYHTIIDS